MLIQLAYISRAMRLMDTAALAELLEQARDINEIEDITGMLLYKDRSFIQVLEGRAENVGKIYQRIEQDARHSNVKMLYRQTIEQRDFPDWSMGFQNLNSPDFEPPAGFSEFMDPDYSLDNFLGEPARAKQLMLFFRIKS